MYSSDRAERGVSLHLQSDGTGKASEVKEERSAKRTGSKLAEYMIDGILIFRLRSTRGQGTADAVGEDSERPN